MCRDRSDLQLNSAGHSLHFHVIHKIINGTASERTLIALNIFFMHPGHMPFKVVLTHRLYSHILHAISSFSFSKRISLELSGNKTSSSISIFDTVKQPPPNIFSMSKHSWNMFGSLSFKPFLTLTSYSLHSCLLQIWAFRSFQNSAVKPHSVQ